MVLVGEAVRVACRPRNRTAAQSTVVSQFKGHDLPPGGDIGEGEINAHSRVQMALARAKNKAKKEFAESAAADGPDGGRVARGSRRIRKPAALYQVPHTKGVVGWAANFVVHISDVMKSEGTAAN